MLMEIETLSMKIERYIEIFQLYILEKVTRFRFFEILLEILLFSLHNRYEKEIINMSNYFIFSLLLYISDVTIRIFKNSKSVIILNPVAIIISLLILPLNKKSFNSLVFTAIFTKYLFKYYIPFLIFVIPLSTYLLVDIMNYLNALSVYIVNRRIKDLKLYEIKRGCGLCTRKITIFSKLDRYNNCGFIHHRECLKKFKQ